MQLFEYPISCLPWIEAMLVGLLLLISVLHPRTIEGSIRALSSPIQRSYTMGDNNPVLMVLRWMFELGSITLALTMVVTARMQDPMAITWGRYATAAGIVLAVALGKGIIDRWIQFAFRFIIDAQTYYMYRNELWMAVSIGLIAVVLLGSGISGGVRWVAVWMVLGGYILVLGWKLLQIFGWSIAHVGYVLLYLAHVEVLPVMVMTGGVKKVFGI